MKIDFSLKLCAYAVALLGSFTHAEAATEFFYTSSPQSWVGAGQTVSVTPATGFEFMPSRWDNSVSFTINDFNSNPDPLNYRWWYLTFSAPFDAPLSVGTYEGATRFPFQAENAPGLSFIGNGRGCNTLTGYFSVLEVEYVPDGVVSFAADFVQYDEGIQTAWNFGSIRYNSDIPTTYVPEPSTALLFISGLCGLVIFARRRGTA